MRKMNLDTDVILFAKIRVVHGLMSVNVKHKTVKLIEDNIREN